MARAKTVSLYDSILITGAGGMLGHAFADALTARKRKSTGYARSGLDIADDRQLTAIFEKHRPTLVLNCAAHTKVDLCEQENEKANAINGYAVGRMAALCQKYGSCFVHVSTDFVFDGSHRRPYQTSDPVNPLSAYGRSKLIGEKELQEHAPQRWLLVRTAWVYGRHGGNFPRTMVQAAQAGKPLTVVDDQFGSPTYTPDLAEGILDLLDAGASGLWHLTNSGTTNWFEFAAAALEQFGVAARISPVTSEEWKKMRPSSAIRPGYSVLDIEPFAKLVGRPTRPWRQALADFRAAVQRDGF
jgi:dTDP-4-dehydrorhamnose reductase